jgi:hypothetical protein
VIFIAARRSRSRPDGGGPVARRQVLEEMLGTASFYTSAAARARRSHARRHRDRRRGPRTNLVRSGEGLIWGNRYDKMLAIIEEAVQLARTHGLPATEALGLAQQAFRASSRPATTRAAPLLERAIQTATECGSGKRSPWHAAISSSIPNGAALPRSASLV